MTEWKTAAPVVAESPGIKLFGKWRSDDAQIYDTSLQDYTAVLVNAIINCGPREDCTCIGRARTMRRQAVDVSPLRCVNQAIWPRCTGALEAAFRNIKTIAECLADELISAAKGSSNSYAIKKKDELECVAKSNRWFSRLLPNKPVCLLPFGMASQKKKKKKKR
uniref:Small ribosomal subunit protein uS7 domain-containing protein n=1 Tax=Colobus angolensis palliatus TaxID=336983 RepID=A0A2K5HFL9_COLAP